MPLNRRQLLKYGLGAGLGSFLVNCSRGSSSAGIAAAAPRDAMVPTPHVDDGDVAPPTIAARCIATADNIEGPFYKPGAPHRAVLVGQRDPGERLLLRGSVWSTACTAIANATLDIWHADHRGGYDNDGFGMRGQLVTDEHGHWQLETIIPGRYLNGRRYRPSHIHVKLRAPGHDELTTQLYFAGDPYLQGDAWVVDSLVMKHAKSGDRRVAAFDFVLA